MLQSPCTLPHISFSFIFKIAQLHIQMCSVDSVKRERQHCQNCRKNFPPLGFWNVTHFNLSHVYLRIRRRTVKILWVFCPLLLSKSRSWRRKGKHSQGLCPELKLSGGNEKCLQNLVGVCDGTRWVERPRNMVGGCWRERSDSEIFVKSRRQISQSNVFLSACSRPSYVVLHQVLYVRNYLVEIKSSRELETIFDMKCLFG
jgi:hypothetical protein